MNVSLYQAASALTANSRWQEMISQNLASSAIPGFKKQELSFSAVEAGLMPANAQGIRHMSMPRATASTSFLPGEMRSTGAKTDLGLEGPGFFEVQLPNGSSAYTRDGEFRLSAQGQLVTKQGHLVLGDSGPLQMDLNNPAPLTVSSNGEVSQGADVKGRLKLMDFNNPKLLTQVGGGLFLAGDPNLLATPASGASVRQGWLEGSNASPVTEMANLMSAMRTFEANQRIIQIQDDRLGKAITQIAGS
ncbi:MAG: flagellar hook-basal body protein [Opitutaceae bacterium]|nr:flagellar hook-basal body protein [Verrucomicrobiales bacterium]